MMEDWIEITNNPIESERVQAWLRACSNDRGAFGAHLIFSGEVRNHNRLHLGKKVVGVSYDVFQPLAVTTFGRICSEIRMKLGIPIKIAMIHRAGRLAVGETSVVVGVATAHRAECYEASRFIVENLKNRAPIWKKEHYEDGETEWLEGHSLCGH